MRYRRCFRGPRVHEHRTYAHRVRGLHGLGAHLSIQKRPNTFANSSLHKFWMEQVHSVSVACLCSIATVQWNTCTASASAREPLVQTGLLHDMVRAGSRSKPITPPFGGTQMVAFLVFYGLGDPLTVSQRSATCPVTPQLRTPSGSPHVNTAKINARHASMYCWGIAFARNAVCVVASSDWSACKFKQNATAQAAYAMASRAATCIHSNIPDIVYMARQRSLGPSVSAIRQTGPVVALGGCCRCSLQEPWSWSLGSVWTSFFGYRPVSSTCKLAAVASYHSEARHNTNTAKDVMSF